MDIIALARNKKYVIETKLETGRKNYQTGLLQIADYMRKESVHEGYYVFSTQISTAMKKKRIRTVETCLAVDEAMTYGTKVRVQQ